MAAEEDRARTVCSGGCHTLKTAASDVPLAAGDVVGPSSPALAQSRSQSVQTVAPY